MTAVGKSFLIAIVQLVAAGQTFGQDQFPSDWQFEALKGQPKTITEFTEMAERIFTYKNVYHFDDSGHLVKIEEHNDWHEDEDSLYLGSIVYYHYPVDKKRVAVTMRAESMDTMRVARYEQLEKNLIQIEVKEFDGSYLTRTEQTLDSLNRMVQTETIITRNQALSADIHSSTRFIFVEDRLVALKVCRDLEQKDCEMLKRISKSFDSKGNAAYYEYHAPDGTTVSRVIRTYNYY